MSGQRDGGQGDGREGDGGQVRDLIIVGAGPAGLAAARQAREDGLDVLVLDEQAAPGGQIWRSVDAVARDRPAEMPGFGASYAKGVLAIGETAAVEFRFGATVWQADRRQGLWRIAVSREGRAERLRSRFLLLATGAMERPVPLPGWTLPGVTTVGALQLGLKQGSLYPRGRTVIVGSGPLPLLLAAQFRAFGIPVAAILDTADPAALNSALPLLPGALLGAADTLLEGRRLLRDRDRDRSRAPVHRGVRPLAIEGDSRAAAIRFQVGGREQVIEADTIALHEGVIPNTQLTRSMDLAHRWNPDQGCFEPVLGPFGESSAPDLFVAGDGGGVLGWRAARAAGTLAACEIAYRAGAIAESARDLRAFNLSARLAAERRLRRFLDAAFPPPGWIADMADETPVCRCEEITAGQIRQAVAIGCSGPNQLKSYLRAGMGPCQGRMCGASVTALMAAASGREPASVGAFRIRAPIKPVTVDEIADLAS